LPLHPFVAALVEKMAGAPALSSGSPEDARALVAAGRVGLGVGPELDVVQNIKIPTRAGAISARLYAPAQPAGVVAYIHGGGWVVGALDDYDTYARALADASGCMVILPDYRLAPEHPFPAGLQDVEDMLLWLKQGECTGIAPGLPLVVAGDSAGANLAAVAVRRLVGQVRPVLQVLNYPVTDCDFETPSYVEHGTGLPLTAADMRWFFSHYAPEPAWTDPDISPLRATSVASVPPALLLVAEYDVLADEGRAYAAKLQAAGITCTLTEVPGLTHGFVRLHNLLPEARTELELTATEIARACRVAGKA
jgi:acetyl esterase